MSSTAQHESKNLSVDVLSQINNDLLSAYVHCPLTVNECSTIADSFSTTPDDVSISEFLDQRFEPVPPPPRRPIEPKDESNESEGCAVWFERHIVKGIPIHTKKSPDEPLSKAVKFLTRTRLEPTNPWGRPSYIVFALGQMYCAFLTLLSLDGLTGPKSTLDWFSVIATGFTSAGYFVYTVLNIYGYFVASKLSNIEKDTLTLWNIEVDVNKARFNLWINFLWVVTGIIMSVLNLVVYLVYGTNRSSSTLTCLIAECFLYFVYALLHRQLAYGCWHSWYRYYDIKNKLGTWGRDNNGKVSSSVVFNSFYVELPQRCKSIETMERGVEVFNLRSQSIETMPLRGVKV